MSGSRGWRTRSELIGYSSERAASKQSSTATIGGSLQRFRSEPIPRDKGHIKKKSNGFVNLCLDVYTHRERKKQHNHISIKLAESEGT